MPKNSGLRVGLSSPRRIRPSKIYCFLIISDCDKYFCSRLEDNDLCAEHILLFAGGDLAKKFCTVPGPTSSLLTSTATQPQVAVAQTQPSIQQPALSQQVLAQKPLAQQPNPLPTALAPSPAPVAPPIQPAPPAVVVASQPSSNASLQTQQASTAQILPQQSPQQLFRTEERSNQSGNPPISVTNGSNPGLQGAWNLSSLDLFNKGVEDVVPDDPAVKDLIKQLQITSGSTLSPEQNASQQNFMNSLNPNQKMILEGKTKTLNLTSDQLKLQRTYMASFVMPRAKAANQAGFEAIKKTLTPDIQRLFEPSEGMKNLKLDRAQTIAFEKAVKDYLDDPNPQAEMEQANRRLNLVSYSSATTNLWPRRVFKKNFFRYILIMGGFCSMHVGL
ncbi:hypothetical protein O181_008831 [Austropuccinia psidii MF-1]|uniref:Uncharacterized protein n=1 Tax=Austropuccinia psidii MF-1 TaxID=1389203 RepID=A0A9Q3BQK8_9BASI|nr:hypothetical protein [Austropuccinia psidii MF-1]